MTINQLTQVKFEFCNNLANLAPGAIQSGPFEACSPDYGFDFVEAELADSLLSTLPHALLNGRPQNKSTRMLSSERSYQALCAALQSIAHPIWDEA